MNNKMIAKELLAVAKELMSSDGLELVTAEEMMQYCPACAKAIEAGEMTMTRAELKEELGGSESIADKVAAGFKQSKARLKTLKFKARKPIDEDEMWEIIEENDYLTVEDFKMRGNNVDILVYSDVDINSRDVKDFVRYMKEYGLSLGQVAAERVAGEMTMTRAELQEALGEPKVAREKKAGWTTDLERFYGRKALPTLKDVARIEDIGTKAWDKYKGDNNAMRRYTKDLAIRMAKSIKTADKAYRRARAAEEENYHTEAAIFFDRAEELWRAMPKTAADRVADKWKSLPDGWTDKSRKKFWDTLTGDVKHKVTKCIKEMDGKVTNPGAFCASLADRVDPGWRSRD